MCESGHLWQGYAVTGCVPPSGSSQLLDSRANAYAGVTLADANGARLEALAVLNSPNGSPLMREWTRQAMRACTTIRSFRRAWRIETDTAGETSKTDDHVSSWCH